MGKPKSTGSSLKNIFLRAGEARQLSWMMIITLITQFISIYKSAVIAANFGAGVELDAYHFANNLSTFFLTFLSSGITTVVIPAYVKELDRKAIDTFLTVVFGITGVLLACTYLLRGQLVDLLTNRDLTFKNYVCGIMLLTMIVQALPALLSVTTAYYQCIGRFNLPKIILMFSNIGIMITLVAVKSFDLYQYLYILLGWALFQVVLDISFAIYHGFRFKISLAVKNPVFIDISKIFLPTLFSTGIYKINTMIDSLLSSNIGTGQLTILSYSETIVSMVNVLIIGNLTAYVFPKIVEQFNSGQKQCQEALFNYAINFHAAVCLLILGFVSVGREFIGLLYEHGEFTAQAATSVYICMCIYIFAQQNNIVRDLIYRYFFANGDTKTTVKNGVMTSIINICTSIILTFFLGIYGIILGTFFAGLYSLIGITVRMKRKYGFLVEMRTHFLNIVKNEMVLITGILFIQLIKLPFADLPYMVRFFVFGTASVLVYTLGMYLCRKNMFSHLK